ncbi:DUF7286 family protein [Halegenticoccus soli]|uniref:DUF7286 family protein n=1 Tax=Halegenticoccus soli TaxID=1985678 RepID=UPI000C6E77AF|nr:hypothetical protein [Halegenticoccus soli]
MKLADDRRARVPFALVGVLLLVTSAAFASTVSTRGPTIEDRAVEAAMDRVEANAATALRSAVREAARDAARAPVTAPASTPAGRALNETAPFRDALRIRIYLRAEAKLKETRYRRGDVVAVASLPAVDGAADLRPAKRRVSVEPVADGTALRVVVRNVARTAKRGGRTVARESRSVTLTVAAPVLALHERTGAFERRLNRGPLDGPGLGRQLTARLYPVAWARGYGQYGGAPIENVVANRHVELSANGGVLAVQRSVFGRSDPAAGRGLARATARVGVQDLLAATPLRGEQWAETVVVRPNGPIEDGPIPRLDPAPARDADDGVTVGVNRSADEAFAAFVAAGDEESFEGTLRGSYRTEARLRTDVTQTRDGDRPRRRPPGPNWTLAGERTADRITVDRTGGDRRPAVGDSFRIGSGANRNDPSVSSSIFETDARDVTVHHRIVRTWRKGNRTRERRAE